MIEAASPLHSTSSSPSRNITVVDVYDLAESINRDFESLAKQFGSDSLAPIVRKVICALETLEALAKHNDKDNSEILDLQRIIERFEEEKKQRIREKNNLEKEVMDLEENYKKEINELCRMVQNLQSENNTIRKQLSSANSEESPEALSSQRTIREEEFQTLFDIRQISIKQKEQIKELQKDVESYSCELENLQNNLEKLIQQNKELLRKNTSLQKQGRLLLLERGDLQRRLQQAEETSLQLKNVLNETSRACKDLESQREQEQMGEDSPRFTLSELREVLLEKNILKARVIELEERLDLFRASSAASETCPDLLKEDSSMTTENPSSISVGTDVCPSTHDDHPHGHSSNSFDQTTETTQTENDPDKKENSEECVVYGPINREPEEKLYPWKYERKNSGVRRFFRFFKDLNTSVGLVPVPRRTSTPQNVDAH